MEGNIFRNPVVLGVLAAVLVYLYIWWDNNEKAKKNPNIKKEEVGFIVPGILGFLVWFLAYNYYSGSQSQIGTTVQTSNVGGAELIGGAADSFDKSFHLVGKNNIKLPHNDVFLDVARF